MDTSKSCDNHLLLTIIISTSLSNMLFLLSMVYVISRCESLASSASDWRQTKFVTKSRSDGLRYINTTQIDSLEDLLASMPDKVDARVNREMRNARLFALYTPLLSLLVLLVALRYLVPNVWRRQYDGTCVGLAVLICVFVLVNFGFNLVAVHIYFDTVDHWGRNFDFDGKIRSPKEELAAAVGVTQIYLRVLFAMSFVWTATKPHHSTTAAEAEPLISWNKSRKLRAVHRTIPAGWYMQP